MCHVTEINRTNDCKNKIYNHFHTGFRRKITQLNSFPIKPNVIKTTAITCRICVYLDERSKSLLSFLFT